MKKNASGKATAPARLDSAQAPVDFDRTKQLLQQYGCGSIQFHGTDNASYERHLIFDHVVDPKAAAAREKFEALAHSVRDVLSQRWIATEQTYQRLDPKRIYY